MWYYLNVQFQGQRVNIFLFIIIMALFRRQECVLHFTLPFIGATSLRYKVCCDIETRQQQYSRLTTARTDTDTFHTAESTTLDSRFSFCDGSFYDDSLLRPFSSRNDHSRLVVRHCRNLSVLFLLSALLTLSRCACVSSSSILV